MADRNSGLTTQETLAAGTASLLLFAISVPALAASSNKLLCDEESDANLVIKVETLTTKVVDHDVTLSALEDVVASHLLAPRAEAAIRDAFEESELEDEHPAPDLSTSVLSRPVAGADATAKPKNLETERSDPVSSMNTRLPGVSDEDLLRFRKQMYRRDI